MAEKATIKAKEFNTIKTIKLINKDSLLQKVYGGKHEEFRFVKLIEKAKANELSDEAIQTLNDIYNSIIHRSDFHVELYNNLKEVIRPSAPNRYGKKRLEADIAAQGGKATPTQETLLLVAELTTLRDKLSKRCINDHYKGTEQIREDDHSKIQEFLKDFNTQLKLLLGDNFSTNGTRD